MRCSPDEVRALARLARLELTEAELRETAADLRRILGWIERIERISGAEDPSSGEGDDTAAGLRADEPSPWPDRDRLLESAPEVVDDHLVVPRVVGTEDAR